MSLNGTVTVLLVEDDEDDFVLARDLFSEIPGQRFLLDWARTFESGLDLMCQNRHDVVLVDYRLGAHNGVELLRAALEKGCQSPVILLTGMGERQVDVEAMKAGAADYLVKGQLQVNSLERSIRYAIQRKRAAALAAFEQARLAAFGAEIGLALTRRDPLDAILARCAHAMAQYLNATLAQVFTFESGKEVFEPRAAAGPIFDRAKSLQKLPRLLLEQRGLREGKPVLLRQIGQAAPTGEDDWLRQEGLVSCAAYPLALEDKLVGLMTVFSQTPLPEEILQEMASVANGISLCIERKRSAAALDASEDKYRSVVENIREIIFQMDEFGNWTFLNPAWTAVTGFEVKPCLGTFFLEYIHEDEREQNRQIFLRLVGREIDYCRYETRFLTKDGKVRWVEFYTQPTFNNGAALLGLSGSLTDITERKLAESAVQKLAAFPKVNPNPVLEFAADGTLTYSNDAAREMAKTLVAPDLLSILPADAGAIARNCLATGQKKLREEVRLQGRTLTWSFFPVAASQVVHCYGTDVTDILNLEAQFRHAQKLESVGQLAAGVAHDFNNLLTVIQGYAECLLAEHKSDNSTPPLQQILGAAQRAASLTRQLLAFSRKQVIQPKVLDLNSALKNVSNLLLRLLGAEISLETAYGADVPRIEADAGMLEQVVMNLVVNSRDAMPKGGKVQIATSRVCIDEAYVARRPDARAGEFVCLTVADTGCGMEARTLERIFEPFFSTKEVGKGTGLGLATVYGIVKQHQGWIEVESQPGAGTTFRVYFPAVSKPADAAQPAPVVPPAVAVGRERILVVEDEPVVRELVCEVLRKHQYSVLAAGSGGEALQTWDENDGNIDLLLTDIVMPEGMNGRELAMQLKKRKPGLKVVYTSGYSPDSLLGDFGKGDVAFLPKPYLPPQMLQLVRQCLETKATTVGAVS